MEQQNETAAAPKKENKKKSSGFKKFLIFIIVISLVWWFNNFTLKVNYYAVNSEKIVNPIRIAVMSDFHAGTCNLNKDTILSDLDENSPDIVFYLGDMYSRDSGWNEIQKAVDLIIGTVELGYPVYFVPGEHDTSELYLDSLRLAGVHVMDYKSEIINVNGTDIQIFGIDNTYFSNTFDLTKEFSVDENYYSILLAHIPMYDYYKKFGADLTLCGDTHGGIIQLPFSLGPAYYTSDGRWFPEIKGERNDVFDKGLFDCGDGKICITSGLGHYPIPARLNNRPEIVIMDILPK